MASKGIPVGGSVVALIDVIVSNAAFVETFLELRRSSESIQTLTSIHFRDGPDGVERQFNQLWATIPAEQHARFCDVIPQLYDRILRAICGWVETIPTVGPPASLLLQSTAGFDMLRSIYIGLPSESRAMFENPERLSPIVDHVILLIYDTLSVDAPDPPPQAGGRMQWASKWANKALTAATSVASTIVAHEVGKLGDSLKVAQSIGKQTARPVMAGLKLAGVDEALADQVVSYTNRVLRPATTGAIKALEIIFPLFFTLLCIVDRCGSARPGGHGGGGGSLHRSTWPADFATSEHARCWTAHRVKHCG